MIISISTYATVSSFSIIDFEQVNLFCEDILFVFSLYRSSHQRCSIKKMFLEISQNS